MQDIPEETGAIQFDLANDEEEYCRSHLNLGSENPRSLGNNVSPKTGEHRMGLKTHRDRHKLGNYSFGYPTEFMTHNPRVMGGLDGISYGSDGNKTVKGLGSQIQNLSGGLDSEITLQKKNSNSSFMSNN